MADVQKFAKGAQVAILLKLAVFRPEWNVKLNQENCPNLDRMHIQLNFLGTYWSNLSDFCINTTTGSGSIILQTFESCLYSKLRNATVFVLIHRTPFSWAACCDIFCQKVLFGKFSSKKRQFWNFFWKQLWHSTLPTTFLIFDAHFLQTHL